MIFRMVMANATNRLPLSSSTNDVASLQSFLLCILLTAQDGIPNMFLIEDVCLIPSCSFLPFIEIAAFIGAVMLERIHKIVYVMFEKMQLIGITTNFEMMNKRMVLAISVSLHASFTCWVLSIFHWVLQFCRHSRTSHSARPHFLLFWPLLFSQGDRAPR